MKTKRVESIDFIRAISVLMIIIFHFSVYISTTPNVHIEITRYIFPFFGGLGVCFFVIISGGANVINSLNSTSMLQFYKKRALSIYPQFYIAYCVTALLLFLVKGNIIFHNEFSKIIYTIFGLDGFLVQQYRTYYLVGEWFLGFIILIYLMFPVICMAYKKNRYITFLFSIIISLLSVHYNSQLCETFTFWNKRDIWNPLARLPEFIFGMIIFDAIKNGRMREIKCIAIVSVAVLIGYLIHDRHDMVINEYRNIPLFSSCAAILTIIFEYGAKAFHGFAPIKFISTYSFMGFLYHHQILTTLTSKYQIPQDRLGICVYGLYVISISFILAYITYGTSVRLQNYLDSFFCKITISRKA